MRKVRIKKPFYLGTYPVTQAEWKAVMGDNPSHFKGDDLPVEQVSWDDVQGFIKKLNEKEGTDKYRLPSEAEWEYACRAGTTTRYSLGCRISGVIAMTAHLLTVAHGEVEMVPSGSSAAVAGAAMPGTAGLLTAAASAPATAAPISAFAFFRNSN